MELAHDTRRAATQADFQRVALPWLPHVSRYARLLARNPSDADDLTQETFLRAYQGWGTFRPGTDCRRWLFAICRNAFLRVRHRDRRMVPADDPEAEMRATTQLHCAHLDTCAHCRDLYTFEGAFLRTVARLLDAPAHDTASLRSRIIHALADAGLAPLR